MTPATFARRPAAWRTACILALAAIFIYLYRRNHGLYPAVFADEWYYSKMSRLTPLAESELPSYLYLWLFRASNACGAGFLDCARAGNLALYGAALPFVWLLARRFAGPGQAWLLTVLAAAAPLNVYTQFFMPEASYWLGFCVLSWAILAHGHWHPALQALAGGVLLGAMSLVKVHALFLVPALCLYLMYAAWLDGGPLARWLGRGLAASLAAAVTTVAIKFGLGWLLAGDAGLSLFGPFYQRTIDTGSTTARLALLGPIAVSALGHMMALAVLYGVALAILLHAVANGALGRHAAPAGNGRLVAWVVLMLGAAAGLAVFYTASLAGRDAVEGMRLHLRYYSFVFPFLWLVVAAKAGSAPARDAWLRWSIAAVLALLLLIAWSRLPGYAPMLIDGPEIATMNVRSRLGYGIVLLQLALLAAWASGRWNAPRLFLLVLLPCTILLGQASIDMSAAQQHEARPGDRAGALVLATVPPSERGQLVVAGADEVAVMRALFHIDRADTAALFLAQDQEVPLQRIAPGMRWLLVMGPHAAPFAQQVQQGDGFTLLRLVESGPPIVHARLSAPFEGGMIAATEGLSVIEPWGRWSDAKQVVFHFTQPLPPNFTLVLGARAFGINTSLPFVARVGDQAHQFRLGPGFEHVRLRFDTDGAQRSLAIEVPQPESPADTAPGSDQRRLGIGIQELIVNEAR